MTRWVSSSNDTAAAQRAVALVTLADLNFASAPVYVNDGGTTLVYGGHTYLGIGQYGGIDSVQEDLQTSAKALQLSLSGVEPGLISSAMTEDYQGRVVTLYVGLLDIRLLTWIANPEIMWEGRMDYMSIDLSQGAATIRMFCENRLQLEPKVARYTNQDQQIAFPGDSFFDLLWMIPLATANWGAVNVTHPATPTVNRNPAGVGRNSPVGAGWR